MMQAVVGGGESIITTMLRRVHNAHLNLLGTSVLNLEIIYYI